MNKIVKLQFNPEFFVKNIFGVVVLLLWRNKIHNNNAYLWNEHLFFSFREKKSAHRKVTTTNGNDNATTNENSGVARL